MIYLCICLAGKVLLHFCQCNLLSISQNVWNHTHKTYLNLLCSPHVTGASSADRTIGSIFLSNFKALWSPLLSSNTTYATLNPCKVYTECHFGFIEAFYSNRLCYILSAQDLTDIITFKWLGWYLNFSTWFMKKVSIIWIDKDKITK